MPIPDANIAAVTKKNPFVPVCDSGVSKVMPNTPAMVPTIPITTVTSVSARTS